MNMRPPLVLFMGWLSLCATGCEIRQAMYDQPKYKPNQASEFFADQRANRAAVPGTVAQGRLHDDVHLTTGEVDGKPAETFPVPVTLELLQRGHERYDIFCSVCHGLTGAGDGMVVQRGFKKPVSFHDPRLRASPPGYYFGNITKGFGQMPSHADQIPVLDRWAIVAYIRALQLSRKATLADVPEAERERLVAGAPAVSPPDAAPQAEH